MGLSRQEHWSGLPCSPPGANPPLEFPWVLNLVLCKWEGSLSLCRVWEPLFGHSEEGRGLREWDIQNEPKGLHRLLQDGQGRMSRFCSRTTSGLPSALWGGQLLPWEWSSALSWMKFPVGFWSRWPRSDSPGSAPSGSVMLDSSLHLSKLWFLHLQSGAAMKSKWTVVS